MLWLIFFNKKTMIIFNIRLFYFRTIKSRIAIKKIIGIFQLILGGG